MTPHQQRIAYEKMVGSTNEEIAQKYGNSIKTIKEHLYQIYKELEVRNVAELIREGTKLGLSPYNF